MCSESDFEKLWFMYKTQGEPKGVSIVSIQKWHLDKILP